MLRIFFEKGDRAEFGPQSTFSKILQRPHRAVVQHSIVHAPSMGALHNLTYAPPVTGTAPVSRGLCVSIEMLFLCGEPAEVAGRIYLQIL